MVSFFLFVLIPCAVILTCVILAIQSSDRSTNRWASLEERKIALKEAKFQYQVKANDLASKYLDPDPRF